MSVTSTAALVTGARSVGRAVGAFNVITLEHVEAVIQGAEQARLPVIIQISENAIKFHGGQVTPLARAARAAAELATVDVALHLDHVTDLELLYRAADAEFSSAMFDAGAAAYAENVARTCAAVEWAHANGLWLEAELGYVGGKPDAPANAHTKGVRTDPGEAETFVRQTGVDALAVAVGSSHAMTSQTASLDRELISRLAESVSVPLVLHGSSGVAFDDLSYAASAGMSKINVGTALNVAYTGSVRQSLDADRVMVDPRKYLTPARAATADVVAAILGVMS
jgi:fructose-bisphosphate aldolase class II